MEDLNIMLQRAAKEAVEIAKGQTKPAKEHRIFVSNGVDVSQLRKKLNLSRMSFSEAYGLKSRTVEKWEQNENKMDATAKAYLTVIANDPEGVKKALGQ